METGIVKLFPPERQLVKDLLSEGLPDGAVIRRSRIAAAIGLPAPQTADDQRAYDLRMLGAVSTIKCDLLEDHSIYLRSDGRGGLVVVSAGCQVGVVMKDGMREIKKAFGRIQSGIDHVRLDELTDEQRKERSNAQAKLAALRIMHSSARRIGAA